MHPTTPNSTTITEVSNSASTSTRVLVRIPGLWLELPSAAVDQLGIGGAPEDATPRQPWYDPAAMLEECERWDGMS